MVLPMGSKVSSSAVSLAFIRAAAAMMIVAVGILALHPDALLAYRSREALAFTHLFLLGFGIGVLMGVMYSLVPVILEVPLAKPEWKKVVFWLWLGGVPLQVSGFFFGQSALIALGGTLCLVSIVLFCVNIAATFRQITQWNRVSQSLIPVLFFMILTPVLGMLQAMTMRYGFYNPERLATHAAVALGGIFLISIVAVGHKLVGMFALSHAPSEAPLSVAVVSLTISVLMLALGSEWGAVPLLIGLAASVFDTSILIRHRNRKAIDVGIRHYLVGIGFLMLSVAGLFLRNFGLAATWFVLGFVGIAIVGMLYKITTFLVWTERYAPKIGKEKVPTLKEMLPEKRANIGFVFLILGAAVFPFLPWAIWIYLAGCVIFSVVIMEVMRK